MLKVQCKFSCGSQESREIRVMGLDSYQQLPISHGTIGPLASAKIDRFIVIRKCFLTFFAHFSIICVAKTKNFSSVAFTSLISIRH